MTALAIRALLLALFVAPAVVRTADASAERCGTKTLYGKKLPLYTMGSGVQCADVERITRGACTLDPDETWGCFSLRPKDPILVWFKTDEMFAESLSGWIEARRPACSRSKVSAAAWKRASNTRSEAFPTRLQVLSDDLIRCGQLRGKRYARITDLLGKPEEVDRLKGVRTAYWQVGPERDSFFQLDSEYLTVRFDRNGRFRAASFTQG
jgi:hypothetical protein